jgi:hypothetical protein
MAKKNKAVGAAVGAKAAKGAARGAGRWRSRAVRRRLGSPSRLWVPRNRGAALPQVWFLCPRRFAIGALVARSGNREDASTFTGTTGQHTPDFGSPAGQRGETWGSGTPTGAAGGAAGAVSDPTRPESLQRPEDPNRTGTGRDYSDPSSGPLIGRSHSTEPPPDIPVQQEEVENRIRTRVGEDPRTADLPHLNVEVNDGEADIRGEVHSEEERQAVEEIASSVEGVTEVRNLLTVNPDAPSRRV